MHIDYEKKVMELTTDEAIYLGDKAREKLALDKTVGDKSYVYQPYPKYVKELGINVSSAEEEERLLKEAGFSKDDKSSKNIKISDLSDEVKEEGDNDKTKHKK